MNKESTKTKILFIITQSEMGGAQQFLIQLLSRLDCTKFSVTLITGSNGKDEITQHIPPGIPLQIARALRRNPHMRGDLNAVRELTHIIREQQPDILFLNSSKAGFIGSLAARRIQTELPLMRVVYRIGGWTFNDPWPWYMRWFYIALEFVSARWKDYIIVNNTFDLACAEKLHIKPHRSMVLIHNGVDLYMPFLERNEARLKLIDHITHVRGIGGGNRALIAPHTLVGTIANFYPAKDLTTLIRAAECTRTRSITYIIIGDGILREQVETEIRNLKLENTVFLAGRIPEARQYLTAFDLFVLPSRKEGFPWTVLEAIAAKVPVVATRVGALPEIIENGKSGILVEPADERALAQAILSLADDEHKRQEFAMQAHQRLVQHFTLNQMVERYESLFTAIAKENLEVRPRESTNRLL